MKTKNEISNTTADVRANPLAGLITALPGGIEASEARGQAQLVRSEVLPKEIRPADRAALEAGGVVFGDPVEGDDLFVHAKLPPGWSKVATDHAMWSKLVDDKGRERAGIFYKAAFYDRKAHLRCTTRYAIDRAYPKDPCDLAQIRAFVKDSDGTVLFDAGWSTRAPGSFEDPAEVACEAWLDEHRPGWRDPSKHWDTP